METKHTQSRKRLAQYLLLTRSIYKRSLKTEWLKQPAVDRQSSLSIESRYVFEKYLIRKRFNIKKYPDNLG